MGSKTPGSHKAKIEYLRTEDMYANVLTKPLQGSHFIREREALTGWAIIKTD